MRMVLVGTVAALAALLPAVADSPLTEAPTASHAPERTVRVEHQLVPVTVVTETVEAKSVEEERIEKKPAPRLLPRMARRDTRPDGFASRARQLFVGDGRYRPEPFPRAGQ